MMGICLEPLLLHSFFIFIFQWGSFSPTDLSSLIDLFGNCSYSAFWESFVGASRGLAKGKRQQDLSVRADLREPCEPSDA